jgi:uncharacterized membrane protein
MITISGLMFSLTMVAVTQASAQYTPRILRNFMSDRVNQLVLGTFVGIFAYCLVVCAPSGASRIARLFLRSRSSSGSC